MPLIRKPVVASRQPQHPVGVDWGNKLASRGLVGAWDSNGKAQARIGDLTVVGATNVVTALGIAKSLSGSGQYLTNTSQSHATQLPLTFFSIIEVNNSGISQRVFDVSTGTTANDVIGIQIAAGEIRAQHYDGSTEAFCGVAYPGGELIAVAAVFESLTSRKLYIDGELVASNSTTVVAPSGIDRVTIGYAPWSSGEYFGGKILSPLLFNAALSAQEIKDLTRNYWQVFKPALRTIFIPSAGGTTSLVLQNSSHGHAADNIALNWQALLSVADSSHSHAADNLGLSTQQLLVVAEAAHAHAADSLTLGTTGSASLAIAEASHGHAADSLVLTTQWLLAIADALHAHAADNLALDTSNAVWLTLQEATHGHLADAVMLTLSSLLAIAESRHGHLADAVHLDPGQVALAIAEAVHAHLAENLTLSVVYPGVFTRAPAGSGPHLRRAIGSRPGSQNTCRHPDPGSAYPTTN